MGEVILQNNNRKVIGKLSRRYLKANRNRNLIAILAIALTTMMFTSLFTIGQGVLDVQQTQTMRQVGGSSHGGFKYLTWEEHQTLSSHPDVKAYGTSIMATRADNASLVKYRTEIRWGDENYAKWCFALPSTGQLPQQGKELATSTVILDAMGIPHELGATIPLEFTANGKKYKEDFILSGFWEGDPAMPAGFIFLSREYIDSFVTISTTTFFERKDEEQFAENTLHLDVMLSNSIDTESKLNKIITESGYDPNNINKGVNWAYVGSGNLDPSMMIVVIISLLLILGAGYLIIYNVFYISVTQDIRNYGLLKTLGTTPRQLRRLIRRQAWLLSIVGIPLGILIGYGTGYMLLPTIINITSYVGADIPIKMNIWIVLGATLFSLLTVWISCNKPCKLASTVSPIEALRTHEANKSKKKSRRSGKLSTLQMSWHNVTRNKKRVISVVLSLTLSVVLLNSVYSATKSFDIDKYMAGSIITDFTIGESALLTQFNLTYLDPQTFEDLRGLPGVITASPVYMQEFQFPPHQEKHVKKVEEFVAASPDLNPNIRDSIVKQTDEMGLPSHLFGIDEAIYNKLEFLEEKPSWEEFSKGDYILASPLRFSADNFTMFDKGETITLLDRNGQEKQYTVLTLVAVPHPTTPLHGHITDIDLILPLDKYYESFSQDTLLYVHLKADETAIPTLEKTISDYCETRTLSYVSRATYMAEFESLQFTYLLVGGVLSGILGLVGILNFINSIVTSILTRKIELAMLQSVGMTTKQLRKMLICEGLWYMVLTAIITLTLGNMLSAFITYIIAGQTWFFSFHFTMAPMMIILPLLLIPAILIPFLAYNSVSRQSVVERLREI